MPRRDARRLWADFVAARADARPGRPVRPGPAEPAAALALRFAAAPFRGVVLGIDPSLRGTGWAVIEVEGRDRLRLVASATLRHPPRIGFVECLGRIHAAIAAALAAHRPGAVACEETIHVQNFRTAQILGAARGAALSAAACAQVPVSEYAPGRIKLAVVGRGAAGKEQVARTVAALLGLAEPLPSDEADAAATALCHAFTARLPRPLSG